MTRTALVTGAARGIGRAIAIDLGRDHALAFTHFSSDPSAILAEHPDALPIHADLTQTGSAEHVVNAVLERFRRLDTLILNAGAIQLDESEHPDRLFQTNVLANDALLAAARPHLKPGACVVAISSVNAILPSSSAVLYSASKAALNTWVRGMAKNLGPDGIRINAVAPGATEIPESPRPTGLIKQFADLTALRRIGRPEDIAPVVRFLASKSAGFMTGEILNVSGGYRL